MQPPTAQEELSEQLRTLLLTLEKTAQSYFLRGQVEQALQLLQWGLQLFSLPEMTQQDQARLLLAYGNMLAVKTQFENAPLAPALSVLEQAKQLAVNMQDEQLLGDVMHGIGFATYVAASNKREGDPQRVLTIFQEALEHRRRLHDERGRAESLFYVGLISALLGQEEAARSSYQEALQIARTSGYPREAAEALRHLGFLEQGQGNFAQAQQYFTEALHLLEHARLDVYLPFAYVVLADVCLAQGNVEAASAHGKIALELARKMDIKKALIFSLLSLGSICQQKQEREQARSYFEQAQAYAQAIDLTYAMQQAAASLHQLSANPTGQ